MTILTDTIGEYTSRWDCGWRWFERRHRRPIRLSSRPARQYVDVDGVLRRTAALRPPEDWGNTESAVATQPGMLTRQTKLPSIPAMLARICVDRAVAEPQLQPEQNLTKLGLIGVRPATWTVTTTGVRRTRLPRQLSRAKSQWIGATEARAITPAAGADAQLRGRRYVDGDDC